MGSWTEDDVAQLRAAVASGVLTVVYDGPPRRQITYQDLKQMRDLLADMERSVSGRTTHRVAAFSKGFRNAGRSSFRRNE